jgi:hypothetical protein
MGEERTEPRSRVRVIDEIFPEYAGAADEIGDSAKGNRGGERGGEVREMARDGVSGSGGARKGSRVQW